MKEAKKQDSPCRAEHFLCGAPNKTRFGMSTRAWTSEALCSTKSFNRSMKSERPLLNAALGFFQLLAVNGQSPQAHAYGIGVATVEKT